MVTSPYRTSGVRKDSVQVAIRTGRYGLALTPCRVATQCMWLVDIRIFIFSFCGECLELSLRFPGIRGFGPYAGEVLPKFSLI
jgi:hypothetical protein